MKKYLIFLFCMFMAIGLAHAQDFTGLGTSAGFDEDGQLQVNGGANSYEIVPSFGANPYLILENVTNLKYLHEGENGLREFKNVKEDSEFSFREGKLVEATFKTTGDKPTEYMIGNYKYKINPGSEVRFTKGEDGKDDSITIIQPVSKDIVIPETIDPEAEKKVGIDILTNEIGSINTPLGIFQSAKGKDGNYIPSVSKLSYRFENGKMRVFTSDKVSGFFNEDGGRDFTVINPVEGSEIYFASSESDIDLSKKTVLVSDTQIGTFSTIGEGPAISIGSGNRLGGRMKELSQGGKTLSFQSKDGYAVLSNGENGDNPLLRLKGASIYGPDGKSISGSKDNDDFYYNPGTKIAEVNHGDGTIPINVALIGKDNKQLPYVFLTNDQNKHIMVSNSKLSNPAKYFVDSNGDIYSANAAFNQLSLEGRKEFVRLHTGNQQEFIKQLNEGGKIAAIQKEISDRVLKNNPLASSVALNGCSGTFVGFHNGKPMVLTAAHCVSGVGGTRNVWLKDLTEGSTKSRLNEDKPIYAKVVAFSARDTGSDVALMELYPNEEQLVELNKRGFTKIIPPTEAENLKIGDSATIIGCPHYTFYSSSCTIRGISETTGTNTLRTDVSPVKGMSGGGLFKDGYLIGVTASHSVGGSPAGYFANPKSIYELLDKTGYSDLYKIFIILVN